MHDHERELEIDWAFRLCDMEFIQWCVKNRIDPNDLKPTYRAGWIAGNRRASAAAEAALARVNSTLETVG